MLRHRRPRTWRVRTGPRAGPTTAAARRARRPPDTVGRTDLQRRSAWRRTRAPLMSAVAQRAMQLLQRHHSDVTADSGLDALHRRRRALHRRHTGNVHRNRRGTDLVAVDAWSRVAVRRVDPHRDLAQLDGVHRRKCGSCGARLFEMLTNLIARNSVAP